MLRSQIFWLVACGLVSGTALAADEPFVVPRLPQTAELKQAPSFGKTAPVVATHYFYWYRWPDEHFFNAEGHASSSVRLHFPNDSAVSYASVAWHKRQMQDLSAAGIDVALPVYWGAPNQYDAPDLRFSVRGLGPLVEALDELAKEGARTPRIGMFYDTSTLQGNHAYREPGHANADVRVAEGKDIFYRTIRDFFCQVPPRHWACLDGRPIVQLYEASFASGNDQSTIEYVYDEFAREFSGRVPCIIAGPSWSFVADLSTGWGAALGGPIIGKDVVQIGPGYDDSPVPGRNTPTRDRLGGGFYSASWLLALQAKPHLVILETWDEMHEGTGLCETLEDGRFYIELTRRYSDLLKSGHQPAADDWAGALRLLLNAPHSKSTDRQFASLIRLNLSVSGAGKLVEEGLRLCPAADGPYEVTNVADTPCVQTRPGASTGRYLYFDVADSYYYDQRGTLTLRFTYFDAGREPIAVEYDSTQETGALADRYKPAASVPCADSHTWKTATVPLTGARCTNRQNGGADFRISTHEALAVSHVEITKLPPDYGR
jgi:hypothetical protein